MLRQELACTYRIKLERQLLDMKITITRLSLKPKDKELLHYYSLTGREVRG